MFFKRIKRIFSKSILKDNISLLATPGWFTYKTAVRSRWVCAVTTRWFAKNTAIVSSCLCTSQQADLLTKQMLYVVGCVRSQCADSLAKQLLYLAGCVLLQCADLLTKSTPGWRKWDKQYPLGQTITSHRFHHQPLQVTNWGSRTVSSLSIPPECKLEIPAQGNPKP